MIAKQQSAEAEGKRVTGGEHLNPTGPRMRLKYLEGRVQEMTTTISEMQKENAALVEESRAFQSKAEELQGLLQASGKQLEFHKSRLVDGGDPVAHSACVQKYDSICGEHARHAMQRLRQLFPDLSGMPAA